MSSRKLAGGAMILRNIRGRSLLKATAPSASSGQGCCVSSVSTPPPEGGNEGVGEKAKQTMDNVLGAAKENTWKLKDRVMGTTDDKSAKPSSNPELNHGVESTDSSCEDVRDRPGGYS